MASENPLWGAERIRGELSKLGIRVAKRTIQTYLRGHGTPCPRGQTWATFLKSHAHTIWACDFLPVTDLLFRPLYAFYVIELATRRVGHVGVTRHPTDAWVAQQLREATPFEQRPRYLLRDNDGKYEATFAPVAAASGIEILRTPYRAPRANAVCERFLGSVRRECLDQPSSSGSATLPACCASTSPPTIGRGSTRASPEPSAAETGRRTGPIRAMPVLGGLHHTYHRAI